MSNLGRIQSRQRDACPAVRSQLSGMSLIDQRRSEQLLVACLVGAALAQGLKFKPQRSPCRQTAVLTVAEYVCFKSARLLGFVLDSCWTEISLVHNVLC